MRHWIFTYLLLIFYYQINAQIEGVVFDIENNYRLSGVHVRFSDKQILITDSLGYFNTDKILTDSILVTHVGYKSLYLETEKQEKFYYVGLDPDYYEIENISISAWNDYEKLQKLAGNLSLLKLTGFENRNSKSVIEYHDH